jgi:hypothetical protein
MKLNAEVETSGSKRMYTDAEIATVKAAIEADPQIAIDLIISAQGGNVEDMRFILESGLVMADAEGRLSQVIIFDDRNTALTSQNPPML